MAPEQRLAAPRQHTNSVLSIQEAFLVNLAIHGMPLSRRRFDGAPL